MGYEVEYCTTIDKPELRGPSFPTVAANSKVVIRDSFPTQSAAVRFFEGILSGEMDFSSEYISWVQVTARLTAGGYRWVRRRIDRSRN